MKITLTAGDVEEDGSGQADYVKGSDGSEEIILGNGADYASTGKGSDKTNGGDYDLIHGGAGKEMVTHV